jgi:hypothetical protein
LTILPVRASRNTSDPWKLLRTSSVLSSAIPPETPTRTRPSKIVGLAYVSDPI